MGSRIVDFDTAAGTAHSNSTDETSLAQKAFAANELLAGKRYDFHGAFRATATNSTDTLTPRVRFGTSATVTSNTECAAGNAVDVADDDVFLVDGHIEVQSSTRAVIYGFITDCDAEGSQLVSSFFQVLTIAVDTAYYLDVTADWSQASASDSVQSEAWSVDEVTQG